MRITMDLDRAELNLVLDALNCRRYELGQMAREAYRDGNAPLMRQRYMDRDNCSILYDYIVALTTEKR